MRNGVVTSHRGTGGGFLLNVAAKDLTLLQVVEAIEGKIELNICLSDWQSCPLQAQCAVHPVWQKAQLAIAKELAAVTIAELATQTTEKSRAFFSEEQQPENPPKPGG